LRYDFEERIRKSVASFRREMLDRLEATIAAIESAIGKGRALRMLGESATAPRRDELGAAQMKIEALQKRLQPRA
jgi:hypothetical protein